MQQRLAQGAVTDPEYRAYVVKKNSRPVQQYHRAFADFSHWKDFLRKEGESLNFQVLDYLLSLLKFADARPCQNKELQGNGTIAHTLFMPGCRIEGTNKEIAESFNLSEETIRTAIAQLKRCGIIVNWGKGWNEFDAFFVWKGIETIRQAYLTVQKHKDTITAITDGKRTIQLNMADHPEGIPLFGSE